MKKSKSMKKISKKIFLTNFLKGYFKALPEKPFFSKKYFFVFYRKFDFNVKKSSNHYSQLKKQAKVDPGTTSHDFLTKAHERIPTIPNIAKLYTTLENRMILKIPYPFLCIDACKFLKGPQIV